MYRIANGSLTVSTAPKGFWWNRYRTDERAGVAAKPGMVLMYDAS